MLYNGNMDNDNYITLNEQGLAEISPTASSDMQQAFIDTYRQTQGENTAQIGEQAHALGSDLEAPYGGLHGPSEYMKSRYQTPQTESRVANLRTAAQLSALNQLVQNDITNWKDKYTQKQREYNKAVLAANKRARARARAANTGSTTTPTTGNVEGEVVTNSYNEYDVKEDALFHNAERQKLYEQSLAETAAKRGISVEELKRQLSQANETNNQGTIDLGIGSYNQATKTFNNGLGI